MSRTRRDAALIALGLVALYSANLHLLTSGDCLPPRLLPFSVLLEADLDLDEFESFLRSQTDGTLHYSVVQRDEHLYSRYPVALPLLLAPTYLPVVAFMAARGLDFQAPATRDFAFDLAKAMEKLCAAAIAALSAAVLFLALVEIAPRRTALGITVLYAIATNTWSIASQALWLHGMAELLLALLLLALLRGRRDRRWFGVAGLAAALLVANRPTGTLFALPALAVVALHQRDCLMRFLLAPLLLAPLLLAYNFFVFGSILGGYGHDPSVSQQFLSETPWIGWAGLLFHPSRGLLVYTPIAGFAVWGGVRVWRRDDDPALRWLSLGAVAYWMLVGAFSRWDGGWGFGPRYLTDVLPVLCALLVPIAGDLASRVPRALFALAVVWSIGVQVIGAFFYNAEWEAVYVLDEDPDLSWSLSQSQLVMSLESGVVAGRHTRLLRRLGFAD